MLRLRQLLDRFRLKTREPYDLAGSEERSVDKVDAITAARTQHGMGTLGGGGAIPPDYVKEYHEGRPRK